ncbi:MAG: lamin tail domain-containing protein, partial [bacterium]|nr:lamin tail domain-containing protein [bacterium]
MRQKFALIVFVLFGSVFPVQAVFGYNDTTTHPALTNSTADFYNLYFTQKMSSQEKEWLISGSIQEDTPPRWINHFYDPVYNQGWTGEHSSDFVSQDLMRKFSDVFFSRESAVSAINWAHNQELQEKYKLYKGNQTWEKAIYEYVKNGNKEEAFRALGDILHLLQDMTVPEHTRNDTHPNDSPYENYANQFTRNSWNISSDLKNQNEQPAVFNSIDDYFNYLANYSNNYFFSKDTINDPKYNKPKITHEDGSFAYGLDKNGNKFELSKVKLEKLNNYEFQKIYDIKDDKFIILSAYWTRLSREAILAGAGVVDLFFKEVEKAKKDESLLKQPPESQSANAYFYSIYGEAIKLKNFVSDVRHSVSNTVAGWFSSGNAAVPKNGNEAAVASALSVSDSNVSNTASSDTANTANANEAALNNSGSPKISQPRALVASDITNVATNEVVEQLQKSIPPQTQPPLPTLAKSNSSEIGLPAGRQDFPKFPMGIPASAVGGGGSAAPIVSNTSVVSQNQSTVQSDSSSENSTTTTTTTETETATTTTQASSTPVVNTDTTPPSVSFSVAECDESLSLDGCLVSATALHLNWQSSDEDLDYFELTQDSAISTTTATSTLAAVSDNSTANFSLRAKDTAGNWSTPTAIILEISKTPVVINEVAWAGTGPSNSQDEWIELYNRTSKSVSLNKWLLYSQTDMGPYLRLSGAIPARSYYLIERTNDDTIKDILADFIAPFGNGLSNSGEILVLSHASTTIDQTVLCGFGPVAWCPGFDYKYRTMERISADTAGVSASNWGYNNTVIQNGKNGKDSAINGTPKSSNSVTHLIANGAPYISTDVTLT